MTMYFRKPVIVDAAQWFPEVGDGIQDVYPTPTGKYAIIHLKNGGQRVVGPGDWCVREPDLSISVYSSEEFHAMYEEVFPGYKGKK